MSITTITNDNETEFVPNDEEVLKQFINLLETRVSVTTEFVQEDSGLITQQILCVRCGDYVSVSEPQALAVPLVPAPIAETGITIN